MKQSFSVRLLGVDQNGTSATIGFTSDPIEFHDQPQWSLNVWFTGLVYPGSNQPEVTIEVSNSSDPDSFRFISNARDIKVPEFFEKQTSNWTHFRVVYDPKGASAGTKYLDLIQFV